jgi:predicted RNA-binding protein YlqC (UPF0109 family)
MGKLVKQDVVQQKIFLVRDKKVMFSVHLAKLYGVEAKVLMQAVKRNIKRFPEDFMFQLTWEEAISLRSQIVTLNIQELENSRSHIVTLKRGKHIKYLPYAFTELGVAMLSSVLKSERAIQINMAIMRAFVRIREMFAENNELAQEVKEHGKILGEHGRHITAIYQLIDELMAPPEEKPKRKIGFLVDDEKDKKKTGRS